jgi:hypothetical protein
MRLFWVCLFCAGCPQPPATAQSAVVVIDGSAPDAASDAPAQIVRASQTAKCAEPAIQPGTCVPAAGDMNEDAIAEWLKRRGSMEDVGYEACRETPFGSEQVLVCTRMGHTAIDRGLGIAGPVEFRRELVIATVRARKRTELLVLPLDFGVGDQVVFTARFTVDATGALDLILDPKECSDAKKELSAWIEGEIGKLRHNDGIEPAFKRQLVAATNLEKASDLARIDAICKAAGHYVLGPNGALAPSR